MKKNGTKICKKKLPIYRNTNFVFTNFYSFTSQIKKFVKTLTVNLFRTIFHTNI